MQAVQGSTQDVADRNISRLRTQEFGLPGGIILFWNHTLDEWEGLLRHKTVSGVERAEAMMELYTLYTL